MTNSDLRPGVTLKKDAKKTGTAWKSADVLSLEKAMAEANAAKKAAAAALKAAKDADLLGFRTRREAGKMVRREAPRARRYGVDLTVWLQALASVAVEYASDPATLAEILASEEDGSDA